MKKLTFQSRVAPVCGRTIFYSDQSITKSNHASSKSITKSINYCQNQSHPKKANKMNTRSVSKVPQMKQCFVKLKRLKTSKATSQKMTLNVGNLTVAQVQSIANFTLKNNIISKNATILRCSPRHTCTALQEATFPKVYVNPAGQRGLGLFAGEVLEPETVIGKYVGEILTNAEYDSRDDDSYGFQYGKCVIDSKREGNYTRFVNSSHKPNSEFIMVKSGGEQHLVLQSLQKIKKGQEITVDYGPSYGGPCTCGESSCSGIIGTYK